MKGLLKLQYGVILVLLITSSFQKSHSKTNHSKNKKQRLLFGSEDEFEADYDPHNFEDLQKDSLDSGDNQYTQTYHNDPMNQTMKYKKF